MNEDHWTSFVILMQNNAKQNKLSQHNFLSEDLKLDQFRNVTTIICTCIKYTRALSSTEISGDTFHTAQLHQAYSYCSVVDIRLVINLSNCLPVKDSQTGIVYKSQSY